MGFNYRRLSVTQQARWSSRWKSKSRGQPNLVQSQYIFNRLPIIRGFLVLKRGTLGGYHVAVCLEWQWVWNTRSDRGCNRNQYILYRQISNHSFGSVNNDRFNKLAAGDSNRSLLLDRAALKRVVNIYLEEHSVFIKYMNIHVVSNRGTHKYQCGGPFYSQLNCCI